MADEILQETQFQGSQKDITPQEAPSSIYIEGNDISLNSQKEKSKRTLNPNDGNTTGFGLGSITEVEDQIIKININANATNIPHQLTITDNLGNVFVGATIMSAAPFVSRVADLISKLSLSFTNAVAGTSVSTVNSGVTFFTMKISGTNQSYAITETINSIPSILITIQPKITSSQFGPFLECANFQIGKNLFILSSNGFIGNVGVAVQDQITKVWTYTILAQSPNLPVSQSAVSFLKGQLVNGVVRLYWVDGNDVPRCFYVKEQAVWTENYAMLFSDNFSPSTGNVDGFYTYGTLEPQTHQQVFANSVTVDNIVVNNNGGVFKSGNIRVAIRMKTSSGNTEFGILSGVTSIPIRNLDSLYGGGGYPPSATNNSTDVTGVVTTKSITISISGVNNVAYQQYEVAIIEYIEGVISPYILGPFTVGGESFSLTLKGNENKRDLTIAEFQQFQPVFKTAHLNEILENKYFLGNVELAQDPNLLNWTRNTLFAIGNIEIRTIELPTQGDLVNNPVSEYNDSGNIFASTGYMYNDTYRVGARYRFKNGLKTVAYYGRDIKIENDVDGHLGNLTNEDCTLAYSYYINLKNIDFATAPAIDGVPFIDLIESVEIVRCDCIPEVLFTGYAMLTNDTYDDPDPVPGGARTLYYTGKYFASGGNFGPYTQPIVLNRQIGKIISQDLSALGLTIALSGNELLLNFGQPSNYNVVLSDRISEYAGYFTAANNPQQLSLNAISNDGFNTNSIPLGDNGVGRKIVVSGTLVTAAIDPANDYITSQAKGISFYADNELLPLNVFTDYGGRYIQIFRPNPGKYGDSSFGTYYGTGTVMRIGGVTGFNFTDIGIFGGDTFTQKCFQKCIFGGKEVTIGVPKGGVSYYAQNRINAQFRNAPYLENISAAYPFSVSTTEQWMFPATDEPILFDQGYMPENGVSETSAYVVENNRFETSKKDTSVYYSDERLDDDLFDALRTFRAANFKTYQHVDGPLVGMWKMGENLFMLQRTNAFTQPISPNIQVATNDISGTILGTGSVLGTKIIPLSKNGTTLKTASFRRISKDGRENIYWFCVEKRQMYRVGLDGMKNFGKDNYYEAFFEANSDYILAEKDVIFGSDPYYDEVLIVANCVQEDQVLWDPDTSYPESYRVYISIAGNKQGFKAKRDVPENVTPNDLTNQFQYWEIDRQSQYTLAFNERNNTFSSFYSFRPTAFATYDETFLSFLNSYLVGGQYYFFEHHTKDDCLYYNDNLVGNPFVVSYFNVAPKEYKHFLKVFIDSLLSPTRIEVANEEKGIMTFMDQSEIVQSQNRYRATVRHDATISATNPTGLNNVAGTGKMIYKWFNVKVFLQKGINLNKLLSAGIVKRRLSNQ